ncbi:MAG TPA: PEPxxWA-CTERM sorting domain-containing protein [Sphingomonas sp.]|uniref:PEPxxWA-CTERM sorting domain-containing protein n=1 Tax=Sphingomonas sp. TaxID=28214 RepID=UPI002BE9C5F6|nr:PEPxxWA-CTERM sorting domain-containing protein [Sphingomonas sp.]HMI20551.1 PEPxxWA-CTERM sorting domain-containing protein [Sphingomonas sp.]
MGTVTRYIACGIIAAAGLACAPAQATEIPDGTVSIVGLFNPTINLGANPNTFTATAGTTFEITGTGGFLGATGGLGSLNGILNFSTHEGTTIDQTIANFFTFADGTGHNFQFSVDSVKTVDWSNTPGISSSFSLYLLGDTIDSFLGYSATQTSLTLTFNSTGGSPYSASATLAVPPAPVLDVPEPATWGLALMGFGMIGATLRRRPRTSIAFA